MSADSGDAVPTNTDIAMRAALPLLPVVGDSALAVYEGVQARRRARARDVVAQIESAFPQPEDLAKLLESDERLDALLGQVVQAAASSAERAKRVLLGRVLVQALLDPTRIDDALVDTWALTQIDSPHITGLAIVKAAVEEARRFGELQPVPEQTEPPIVQRIKNAGDSLPRPIVLSLKNIGLLTVGESYAGDALTYGLTPFGERLIADLQQAASDGEALHQDEN